MLSEKLWGRQYSRIPHDLSDDVGSRYLPERDDVSQSYEYSAASSLSPSRLNVPRWILPSRWKRQGHSRSILGQGRFLFCCNHKRSCSRLVSFLTLVIYLLVILLAVTATCFPSYSNPPPHYSSIAQRCKGTGWAGCANSHDEKVFIAASILDKNGSLISGPWARAVLKLIDLIGPDNVFLSVYENGADASAKLEIQNFAAKLRCMWKPI